jgi:mono/diheme cytochrome c family protein
MRRRAVAAGCALALAVAGCGAGDKGQGTRATTPRAVTAIPVAPGRPVRDAPIAAGRHVFEQSGCLACHQLLRKGASGPGNNLTGIGARRSKTEILRALVNPEPPMPSFRELPAGDLDDLVAYLSALRESALCARGADCG